jgi:hypothetical protein
MSLDEAVDTIRRETELGYWDKVIVDEFLAMIREEEGRGEVSAAASG